MKRIEQRDLEVELSVALRHTIDRFKHLFKPMKVPLEREEFRHAIAKDVVEMVIREDRILVEADRVPDRTHAGRRGVFGVDEPWPSV